MGTDRVEMMSSGMAGGGREEPACVRPLLVGLQHRSCHLLLITVLEAFGTVTPQAGGEGTSPGRVCACSESHSCVAQRGGLEHSTAFLIWDLSALPHCGGCGTWEGLGFPGENTAEG